MTYKLYQHFTREIQKLVLRSHLRYLQLLPLNSEYLEKDQSLLIPRKSTQSQWQLEPLVLRYRIYSGVLKRRGRGVQPKFEPFPPRIEEREDSRPKNNAMHIHVASL